MFVFSYHYLSYSPLWVAIIFRDLMSIVYSSTNQNLWTELISIIVCIILWIISTIIVNVGIKVDQTTEEYTLEDAKLQKTLTSDFVLSNILPLFAFDFSKWYEVIIFVCLYCVLCLLRIRHKSFSVNIVFELLKFDYYECELSKDNSKVARMVMSKEKLNLKKGETIRVKYLNNGFAIC